MRRVPSQQEALSLWSVVRRWMLGQRVVRGDPRLELVPVVFARLVDDVAGVMGYWTPEDGEAPRAVPGPPVFRAEVTSPVKTGSGLVFQAGRAHTFAPARAVQGRLPFSAQHLPDPLEVEARNPHFILLPAGSQCWRCGGVSGVVEEGYRCSPEIFCKTFGPQPHRHARCLDCLAQWGEKVMEPAA